jgi:hypothetical protein
LFFAEGFELLQRGWLPLLLIAGASALLQGFMEAVWPGNDDSPGKLSAPFVLSLLLRTLETAAMYAVLTSRHPGARWSLTQLRADALSQVSMFLLLLAAFMLTVVPVLGAFALPVLLLVLAFGGVAPVPMLYERLSAPRALRKILQLAVPVLGPFFAYATLLNMLEWLAGWGGRALLGEVTGDVSVAIWVALIDAVAGACSAAVFVAMYFRLPGLRAAD